MTRHRFLIGCAAVFVPLYGAVGRAAELDAVVKRLDGVSRFALGGVGLAGSISEGESDFKVILSQAPPVALAAFENVYEHGNEQAKAYALVGIRKLDPHRYKELLATATASTGKVEVMRGCIITHELLKDVAKEIDAGGFRSKFDSHLK